MHTCITCMKQTAFDYNKRYVLHTHAWHTHHKLQHESRRDSTPVGAAGQHELICIQHHIVSMKATQHARASITTASGTCCTHTTHSVCLPMLPDDPCKRAHAHTTRAHVHTCARACTRLHAQACTQGEYGAGVWGEWWQLTRGQLAAQVRGEPSPWSACLII